MSNKHFTLRITDTEETLYAKFKYIADSEDRSINKELWRLIRRHVQDFEAEHGEIKVSDLAESDKQKRKP